MGTKLITRDVDYAIKSLCFIAEKGKRVSVSDMVKNLKIPRAFLRKILRTLEKNGVLKSYKGKGGGFILNCFPDDILLIDIIEIFQGKLKMIDCVFKKGVCPDIKNCPLRKKILKIEKYILSKLKKITLESLLKLKKGGENEFQDFQKSAL